MPQLTLTIPHPSQVTVFDCKSGQDIKLTFDINNVSVMRTGKDDLTIEFPDNGKIVLNDFFVVNDGETLPEFVLSDGSSVSGSELLASIAPSMDLTTAMGTSPTVQGSGTDYADDSGTLIDGLDRLGDLGTFYWNRELQDMKVDSLAPLVADGVGVAPPVVPPVEPPPPEPPIIPENPSYIARAVLYKMDDTSSDTVKFRLLDADGNTATPDLISYTVSATNGYFQLPPLVNPDGTLSLTLSAEGLQALSEAHDANIYDYIKVNVDGYEYHMQVVVNQNGDLFSHAEDMKTNFGSNITAYEWHSETGQGTPGNNTGTGDRVGALHAHNEAWFLSDDVPAFSGSFTTDLGNDTVTVDASNAYGIKGGSIDTGAGYDRVRVVAKEEGIFATSGDTGHINHANIVDVISTGKAGISATQGGSNTVENADTVTVTGKTHGLQATSGGSNTLTSVTGDVTVTGGIGMAASDAGSHNLISQVDGKIIVTGTIGMDARVEGRNEIIGTNADNEIIVNGSIQGKDTGSSNTIDAGAGDDSIRVAGITTAMSGGTNTILAGAGNDTILMDWVTASQAPAGNDSVNIIDAGEGNNTLNFKQYIMSMGSTSEDSAGGTNKVLAGSGDDTVHIEGGVTARNQGTNLFDLGDGNNTLTINQYLQADAPSSDASKPNGNTIITGSGDDTVILNSPMYAEGKGSSNSISLGTGNNSLNITTKSVFTKEGASSSIISQSQAGETDIVSMGWNMQTSGNDSKGSILMGDGDSTVLIKNQLTVNDAGASNVIDLGEGANELRIGDDNAGTSMPSVAADHGGLNRITGGSAADVIFIKTEMTASNEGKTEILTRDGDDEVTTGRIFAQGSQDIPGGENLINLGSGQNSLRITADMEARGKGKNTIIGGDDGNTITVEKDLIGNDPSNWGGGINSISTGSAVDTIAIEGVIKSTRNSSNTINAGAGDDSIKVAGTMTALSGGTNTLLAGAGNDTILIGDGVTASQTPSGNDSVNIIDAGEGDNTLRFEHHIMAMGSTSETSTLGGTNKILAGSGDDTVHIEGGVVAQNQGTNLFDLGDGNNTLTIDYYLQADSPSSNASKPNSNTIMTGSGDDTVILNSPMHAEGKGSSNTLSLGTGNNSLDITTKSVFTLEGASSSIISQSQAGEKDIVSMGWNMQTSGNDSKGSILMGDGDSTVLIKNQLTVTGSGASNIIDLGEGANELRIGDDNAGTNMPSVGAGRGGLNRITGGSATDVIFIKTDINTSDEGKTEILTRDGDDEVTTGRIFAQGKQDIPGGENLIDLGSGQNSLRITADLEARGKGKNTIIGGDDGNTITVEKDLIGSDPSMWGGGINSISTGSAVDTIAIEGVIKSTRNSSNTINAGAGDDSIKVAGTMTALSGGTNTLLAGAGNDTILIGDGVTASQAPSGNDSVNIIDAGEGDNTLRFEHHIMAMGSTFEASTLGGTNKILTGSGDDTVHIEGGVVAQNQGTNLIDLGDGNNTLTIDYYLQADSPSSNASKPNSNTIMTGSGDDTVILNSPMHAEGKGSSNTISLGTGNNSLDITDDYMITLEGASSSIISQSQAGEKDIVSMGWNMQTSGNDSKGSILMGDGDSTVLIKNQLTVTGSGASNIIDLGEGANELRIGDDNAGTSMPSVGADYGGLNRITGGSATDVIFIKTVINTSDEGKTEILTRDGDDEVTTGRIFAQGKQDIPGGENLIDLGSGQNSLRITADLEARCNGKNTIIGGDDGNTITVEKDIIGSDPSNWGGGINSISTGSGADEITIAGLIKSSAGSVNTIDSGAGNDIIRVGGNISIADGGNVFIATGEGDDTLYLNGKISTDFALDMGTGGNDTLVLTIDDFEQFEENFADWLNSAGFGNASVENIQINYADENPATIDSLKEFFKDGFDNINIMNSSGEDLFLAEYLPANAASSDTENFTLYGAEEFTGFETVNHSTEDNATVYTNGTNETDFAMTAYDDLNIGQDQAALLEQLILSNTV